MAKTAEASVPRYNAGQIQVLKGLEAVRKRPGMYIGSTSSRGLHHLVYEVVDNSIDEALAGHAEKVDVTIHADDSITVVDDGRGIPVDNHPTEHIPGIELAMTVLHAGGKFDKESYKVSGGLHGVGVSVVNALAEELKVWVKRDGKEHYMDFVRGGTRTKLKVLGKVGAKETGTKVWFKPDPEIFTELRYDYATLAIVRDQELIFFRTRQLEGEADLADVIHQTAMYHEDRLAGARFARVVLSGASARGAETGERLRRSLEERMGAKVEALDFRGTAAMRDRISAGADLLDALAPAVGVVLRERVA